MFIWLETCSVGWIILYPSSRLFGEEKHTNLNNCFATKSRHGTIYACLMIGLWLLHVEQLLDLS
jgi:hypothetical protein